MKTFPRPAATAALALCLLPGLPAQESVPLGHAVAKDAHLVMHGVSSQTPDPAMAAFERAMTRLIESRVHEDILDLATMDMGEKRAARVRGMFDHVLGILGRVDWADLTARLGSGPAN